GVGRRRRARPDACRAPRARRPPASAASCPAKLHAARGRQRRIGYPPARLTASVNARLANTRQRCDLYSTEPCRSACTSTPSAAFCAAASIAAASSFLPVQPASTPFARTALVPAPVTPIDALEQAPLPSSVTAAATPTTANREAGCGNFMYAAPVLAGRP